MEWYANVHQLLFGSSTLIIYIYKHDWNLTLQWNITNFNRRYIFKCLKCSMVMLLSCGVLIQGMKWWQLVPGRNLKKSQQQSLIRVYHLHVMSFLLSTTRKNMLLQFVILHTAYMSMCTSGAFSNVYIYLFFFLVIVAWVRHSFKKLNACAIGILTPKVSQSKVLTFSMTPENVNQLVPF